MDTNRIFKGAIIWSLGFLMPILHHSLLMLAAVQEDGYQYPFSSIVRYFFPLPWILWPYLIAMIGIVAFLVISCLRQS